MQIFNHISNAIFDVLLAPFGHAHPLFDLLLWPGLMGVLAILVYKVASNQQALARVKGQISMRLLEIRLFSHDIVQVLKSTGMIFAKNFLYLGNHMLPMLVMIGPFVVILAQLVANYAYDPSPRGAVELLHVRLDPDAGISSRDITLALPEGITLDAPPVQTADHQAFWRLRADAPGDHVLSVKVGDEVFQKTWAVGGPLRKVPVKRLRGFEAILYPGESALPAGGPVLSMELGVHPRALPPLPAGELGIVLWVLIWSLVVGFAVKGLFGVTI
ncbi:MAG: hypothetical protein OEM05_05490 [Myxococcales bacterium]|nr:hypothetical protein [Myxococcales bacterium]